jgi:hypothetical protein
VGFHMLIDGDINSITRIGTPPITRIETDSKSLKENGHTQEPQLEGNEDHWRT